MVELALTEKGLVGSISDSKFIQRRFQAAPLILSELCSCKAFLFGYTFPAASGSRYDRTLAAGSSVKAALMQHVMEIPAVDIYSNDGSHG